MLTFTSRIMIKGEANRGPDDGNVVNTEDLAKHAIMFISTTDIEAKLKA